MQKTAKYIKCEWLNASQALVAYFS